MAAAGERGFLAFANSPSAATTQQGVATKLPFEGRLRSRVRICYTRRRPEPTTTTATDSPACCAESCTQIQPCATVASHPVQAYPIFSFLLSFIFPSLFFSSLFLFSPFLSLHARLLLSSISPSSGWFWDFSLLLSPRQ